MKVVPRRDGHLALQELTELLKGGWNFQLLNNVLPLLIKLVRESRRILGCRQVLHGAGSAELKTLDGNICFRDGLRNGLRDVFGAKGHKLVRRPDLKVFVKDRSFDFMTLM